MTTIALSVETFGMSLEVNTEVLRLHLKELRASLNEMPCKARIQGHLCDIMASLVSPAAPHTPKHCEEDYSTFLLFFVGEIREIQENI